MNKLHTLILALLLSLGLNLLMAGVYIGRAAKPAHEPPPMHWAAQRLSPQTQQLLRRRMREQIPEVRPLREELRAAAMNLGQIISAEDFDARAFADALARKRDVDERYQRLIHENLAKLAADLPREQRMALIATVMQRAPGGQKRREQTQSAGRLR